MRIVMCVSSVTATLMLQAAGLAIKLSSRLGMGGEISNISFHNTLVSADSFPPPPPPPPLNTTRVHIHTHRELSALLHPAHHLGINRIRNTGGACWNRHQRRYGHRAPDAGWWQSRAGNRPSAAEPCERPLRGQPHCRHRLPVRCHSRSVLWWRRVPSRKPTVTDHGCVS